MASTSFIVQGIVHTIMTCTLTQVSPAAYTIREVSNSPTGYEVSITTDGVGTYDGDTFQKDSVLTNISSQKESIIIVKNLTFTEAPTYVKITCGPHE